MEPTHLDRLRRQTWLPVVALFVVLASIIVKSAWLGDDAYIGFRSIDNLLNGYGFRWNIDERVQVFTDPLKLLLIAICYAITDEIFITAIVFCMAASLGAVFVLVRHLSVSATAAGVSIVALLSSKAWIDYSTSGLENPVNYLLVALFCVPFLGEPVTRGSWRLMVLFYALVGFNRLDLLLLLFPAMAYATWAAYRARIFTWRTFLLDGFIFSAPLWGWLLFATIYFGYALPNTYYAKLYTGIPTGRHVVQGLMYYVSLINSDPVTLLLIGFAVAVGFLSGNVRLKLIAIGLILYLLYIVKIGGDFMAGRFFSVPFFFAVIILAQMRLRPRAWFALAIVWFAIGLAGPTPPFFYNENYTGIVEDQKKVQRPSAVTDRRGIADERGGYYPDAGLLPVLTRQNMEPPHGWALAGKAARATKVDLVAFGTPGFYGFYAGPAVHIVDYYGLGDPLIARLPIYDPVKWQVGHYARSIPKGYIESLQSGTNMIENSKVRQLYDSATILTKDPIWSVRRFREIWKANTGGHKKKIRAIRGNKIGPPPYDAGSHGGAPVVFGKRGPISEYYEYGTVISFAQGGTSERYRIQGWGETEQRFTWTEGKIASLMIPVRPSAGPVTLEMKLRPMTNPPELTAQTVHIVVNDETVATWQVSDDRTYQAVLPAKFFTAAARLAINLQIPNAISPAEAGHSSDTRQLGLAAIQAILVEHGTTNPPSP
jgi:arabinofuranosyltransferase